MTAEPTEAEVDRVSSRLAALWKDYQYRSATPVLARLLRPSWALVGPDVVGSLAGVPFLVVPLAVLLDPDAEGVVPDELPDTVPADWG